MKNMNCGIVTLLTDKLSFKGCLQVGPDHSRHHLHLSQAPPLPGPARPGGATAARAVVSKTADVRECLVDSLRALDT